MRCLYHSQDIIGTCNWCGKGICQECTHTKEGNKLVCASCSEKIAFQKKAKVPLEDIKPKNENNN